MQVAEAAMESSQARFQVLLEQNRGIVLKVAHTYCRHPALLGNPQASDRRYGRLQPAPRGSRDGRSRSFRAGVMAPEYLALEELAIGT